MGGDITFGYYAELGCSFDVTPDALKKAFRKASLRWHPDRNPGDEAAKERFQRANMAHACLSDAARRAEYDAIFRMRCVLEQGALTAESLRAAPLDAVYMFAVSTNRGLGMGREESVLMVNLVDGLSQGRIERWRHGEATDVRPLSALR